jgi:hypothetical protein
MKNRSNIELLELQESLAVIKVKIEEKSWHELKTFKNKQKQQIEERNDSKKWCHEVCEDQKILSKISNICQLNSSLKWIISFVNENRV